MADSKTKATASASAPVSAAMSAPAKADPPAPPEPKTVRVRMVIGAAGALPQAWLISPAMFGLAGEKAYRVTGDPEGVEVPYDLARALTDKSNAERCRGRRFEIL